MIEWAIGAAVFYYFTVKGGTKFFEPDQFDSWFKKYAGQYGLDWKVLKAIAMNESGLGVAPGGIEKSVLRGLLNPSDTESSKSYDGKSWGLMQMTLPTAKDFDAGATAVKLNNPEYSIMLAARFVAWVTTQFKVSDPRFTEWVIKSYNQGVGGTYKEMRGERNVAAVQEYWSRYQRNYEKIRGQK